ncbi:MAG: hypothetical protein IT307_14895 [Chloroflexi bacterium]|nr:hypothetical protein [Chloroflexota bacterium]
MDSPTISRRRLIQSAGLAASGLLWAACGSTSGPASSRPAPAPSAGAQELPSLILANSELVVGRNRVLLAAFQDGQPLRDAEAVFDLYAIGGQTSTKRAEVPAIYRTADGVRGVFAAQLSFDSPGAWGIGLRASRAGQPIFSARTTVDVQASTPTPAVGSRAIPSVNKLLSEVADPAEVCSAQPVCEMHTVTIRDALGMGRPLVVVFATPGYCTSQMCAPVLNEVLKVRAQRVAEASFVHIEIFSNPRDQIVAEPVAEWRLMSEPWTFVVDRAGVIAERFESVTVAEEIDDALRRVL